MKWSGLGKVGAGILGLSLLGTAGIALRLQWIQHHHPQPELIVVLGGDFEREYFAAYFAQEYPTLPILISSGMPEAKSRAFFAQVGVERDRLNYDNQAVDTLTNFTTLLPQLHRDQLRHVFVITSDFHRARSRWLAFLIWGSQGIAYEIVAIPTHTPAESWWLIGGDVVRSLVWLLTGIVMKSETSPALFVNF